MELHSPGLRSRSLLVAEHIIPFDDNKQTIKLLAEYHHLANATPGDTATAYNYPSEGGWAAGIQHTINLNTPVGGSSNQAVRPLREWYCERRRWRKLKNLDNLWRT